MVRCPECGSQTVGRLHRTLWDRLWSLLGYYPFRCESCGRRFRERFTPPASTA